MKKFNIDTVIASLKKEAKHWDVPVITAMYNRREDPFRILISTVLSTRTKDETTHGASKRLFSLAKTPQTMMKLPKAKIEKAVYPVGFYRTKAKNIKSICERLIKKYRGHVPEELDELLNLPGVGRKVANLVITRGYGLDGICVDTHVHRISNRWDYIRTHNPRETEMALRKKLPRCYWHIYNDLLVAFGQTVCKPMSPFCSQCKIRKYCRRIGVKKYR